MSARVVHMSTVHPAVDTRISVKECGALAAAGYDVVFMCPHDGPPVVNGVRVVPLPLRRNRFQRMVLGAWDALRTALALKADIYHFHDAELLPVGIALRMTGARVVYDVHEDLPRQILAKPWMSPWVRGPMAAVAEVVERLLAAPMSGIVAATPPIARRFPADRTVTVQNFAMTEEMRVQEQPPYATRENLFAYIGGLTPIRGTFEMVRAMELLPPAFNARLMLAGLLSDPSLRPQLERTAGWERTEYLGWQHREQVARHLGRARAGLLLIHPTQNYLVSYPGKAFEYMAAGLPLIVSDFPLWRELFGHAKCALFVDPLDPPAIARAMEWVLLHPGEAEAMGARGRQAVLATFNWQNEAAKLLRLYDRLLPASPLQIARAQAG